MFLRSLYILKKELNLLIKWQAGGCLSISSANLFWKLSDPDSRYNISSIKLSYLIKDTNLNKIELPQSFFQEIKLNLTENAELDLIFHLSCDNGWSLRTESTLNPQSHYVRSRIEPDYSFEYQNFSIGSEVDIFEQLNSLKVKSFDKGGKSICDSSFKWFIKELIILGWS